MIIDFYRLSFKDIKLRNSPIKFHLTIFTRTFLRLLNFPCICLIIQNPDHISKIFLEAHYWCLNRDSMCAHQDKLKILILLTYRVMFDSAVITEIRKIRSRILTFSNRLLRMEQLRKGHFQKEHIQRDERLYHSSFDQFQLDFPQPIPRREFTLTQIFTLWTRIIE